MIYLRQNFSQPFLYSLFCNNILRKIANNKNNKGDSMKKKFVFYIMLLVVAFSTIFVPTQKGYASSLDDLSAKAVFLMDYNTQTILYEKNATERMPVASIVKLMTIELICEEIEKGNLSLDDTIIASENASSMGGSQVFIETGGEYSVGDMLKSAIVSSANDASVALAEKVAGSEDNFVVLMNNKAKEFGLENTNYVNATGLPATNQFSCAKDTAKLLKHVTSHDAYHKYSTIWMDTLLHPKGRESELVNTNKLIRYYEGCDGGKTGSTNEAGYCLSATAKRENMRLIGVVLGAENSKKRFAETSQLLNYGFANFENKKVVDSNKTQKIEIKGCKQKTLTIHPESDLYIICNKKDKENNFSIETKLKEHITAPITIGDSLGEILVVQNGQVISSTKIISKDNVEKASFIDYLSYVLNDWCINK